MEETIRELLEETESAKNIEILSAREVGSRLYGVPHSDSDWDVHIIYAFDEAWKYPAPGYSQETITTSEGEIEIHGWNIDKFVELYTDSNPNVMEFLAARPYTELFEESWREIEETAMQDFNHMTLYHHYISLAKSNYTQYIANGNDRTAGRQFYIARALACASHIRQAGEFPPMDAFELAESGEMNDELRGLLRRFAEAKQKGMGDTEQPDLIGPLYEAESEAPMDPTDERISSLHGETITPLIEQLYES